jgi:hypothetical protein
LFGLNKIFTIIKKLFKGWFEKRLAMLLVVGGIGIASVSFTQSWWADILYPLVNKVFGLNLQTPNEPNIFLVILSVVVGGTFVCLGLWFYFHTREKDKKQTMIQIRHSSIESVSFTAIDKDLEEYNVEEYFLNQVEEMNTINKANLQHALKEQEKMVQRIAYRLHGSSDVEIAYLGLAHIPLSILLGYQLADKSNTTFFEWNQNKLLWVEIKKNSGSYPQLFLDIEETLQSVEDTKEIIIKIGITYPVTDADLSGLQLEGLNRYYLHLKPPHRNAIIDAEQLNEYQQHFRDLLDRLNQKYANLKKIHLFHSGQPSLAYRLGSSISPRMDAEVWAYNYVSASNPRYPWAINLKKIGQPILIKFTGGNGDV